MIDAILICICEQQLQIIIIIIAVMMTLPELMAHNRSHPTLSPTTIVLDTSRKNPRSAVMKWNSSSTESCAIHHHHHDQQYMWLRRLSVAAFNDNYIEMKNSCIVLDPESRIYHVNIGSKTTKNRWFHCAFIIIFLLCFIILYIETSEKMPTLSSLAWYVGKIKA